MICRLALLIVLTIAPALAIAANQPTVVTSEGPVMGFHRDGVTHVELVAVAERAIYESRLIER